VVKKYIVRLTDQERQICQDTVRKPRGSFMKRRRAQILLKADTDGPGWTDEQIAQAFDCRTQTVENIRQRLVTCGFESTLCGEKCGKAPRPKLLDGEQEAKVIALRLGQPPAGFSNWSLRLLAGKVVELGIVSSISHETVRQTLKKTG
jgi:Homeodomain-like domain